MTPLVPRFALAVGVLFACGDSDDEGAPFPPRAGGALPVDRPTQCTETDYPAVARSSSEVVNGTFEPTSIPLTRRQRNAVVSIWRSGVNILDCSGALISPTVVVSAAHCPEEDDLEVRFGPRPGAPERIVAVDRVTNHPTEDLRLLFLDGAVTDDVTPLPVGGEGLEAGETVELAGFGQREDGFDERRFVASPVSRVTERRVVVDGSGRRGLCFGDSGGPALRLSPGRNRVEVIGVLSSGDTTCVGEDRYLRLDSLRAFIADRVDDAPTAFPIVCDDGVTAEGGCTPDGDVVTCRARGTSVRSCPAGATCGWSDAEDAYACLDTPGGACGEVTQLGRCEDGVLEWCDSGVLRSRDCVQCGGSCRRIDGQGSYGCADEACSSLPEGGRCARDVVEYCDADGRLRQLDCRGIGHVCRETGGIARCVVPDGLCPEVGFEGTCVDATLVYCQQGEPYWINCAAAGRRCAFADPDEGYACVE